MRLGVALAVGLLATAVRAAAPDQGGAAVGRPAWAWPVKSPPVSASAAVAAKPAASSVTPAVYACDYCHLRGGEGRPENASLAGLPEDYLRRQVAEIQAGTRVLDAEFPPTVSMLASVKQSAASDVDLFMKRFAAQTYLKRVKVVEASDIPRATPNQLYVFDTGGAREPLGQRIVEGADDHEQFERRDPLTRYTAYVPVGSIARGAALANGAGNRVPCTICHGQGLKGGAIGPPIAGRFATGLFRQLYAFSSGARGGTTALIMQPYVLGLSQDDMIDLSAYVASLEP